MAGLLALGLGMLVAMPHCEIRPHSFAILGYALLLLVAQAQRDFTSSQIAEVQAVVNYLKSLVEIYRQEGSLLERSGIEEEL